MLPEIPSLRIRRATISLFRASKRNSGPNWARSWTTRSPKSKSTPRMRTCHSTRETEPRLLTQNSTSSISAKWLSWFTIWVSCSRSHQRPKTTSSTICIPCLSVTRTRIYWLRTCRMRSWLYLVSEMSRRKLKTTSTTNSGWWPVFTRSRPACFSSEKMSICLSRVILSLWRWIGCNKRKVSKSSGIKLRKRRRNSSLKRWINRNSWLSSTDSRKCKVDKRLSSRFCSIPIPWGKKQWSWSLWRESKLRRRMWN